MLGWHAGIPIKCLAVEPKFPLYVELFISIDINTDIHLYKISTRGLGAGRSPEGCFAPSGPKTAEKTEAKPSCRKKRPNPTPPCRHVHPKQPNPTSTCRRMYPKGLNPTPPAADCARNGRMCRCFCPACRGNTHYVGDTAMTRRQEQYKTSANASKRRCN